jgi:hypothetical protein
MGPYDDHVDPNAQMLDWFKRDTGPSSNAGIFQLFHQRAEEHQRGQWSGPCVRLRARRSDFLVSVKGWAVRQERRMTGPPARPWRLKAHQTGSSKNT